MNSNKSIYRNTIVIYILLTMTLLAIGVLLQFPVTITGKVHLKAEGAIQFESSDRTVSAAFSKGRIIMLNISNNTVHYNCIVVGSKRQKKFHRINLHNIQKASKARLTNDFPPGTNAILVGKLPLIKFLFEKI